MAKNIPSIQKFMTTQPYTVDRNQTLKDAKELMAQHDFRHLPVMDGSLLFGVLSDRDIKLAMGFTGTDLSSMKISDICHQNPYEVNPDSPLDDVAEEMAAQHYGCAVVTQNGRVVGIFTTVDACRCLADTLRTRWHGHGGT